MEIVIVNSRIVILEIDPRESKGKREEEKKRGEKKEKMMPEMIEWGGKRLEEK